MRPPSPLQTESAKTRAKARARWLDVLDRSSIAAFALVWIAALAHLAPAFASAGWTGIPASLFGLLAGFLLADFASGLVHWMADRYFDPTTPLLGPALIAPFREHHEDALAMTRHDFFEVSGNNALVSLPIGLGLLAFPQPTSTYALVLSATLMSFGGFVVATNQFHCWAHVRRPPTIVKRLQRAGLLLSAETHRVHHRRAHDRAYCVTSGWMNPLLDGIGFFPALENLIARFQSSPKRSTPSR